MEFIVGVAMGFVVGVAIGVVIGTLLTCVGKRFSDNLNLLYPHAGGRFYPAATQPPPPPPAN